ncbi:MAG: hypothetical protein AB1451_08595 [Nitrospirota bacterium]
MTLRTRLCATWLMATLIVGSSLAACAPRSDSQKPRLTMFVAVDTSGSFGSSGYYDDSLTFLAHYLYGHLNGLGGLAVPRELFVGSIGGQSADEPKAFHPIHDFSGKTVEQIEADLRTWFPPTDTLTDYNAFFRQVARISKERNLVLAPISLVVISDGIPDANGQKGQAAYTTLDLSSLDYLTRNLTLRLAYASPKVGDYWRKLVPRQRVRMWTVEAEVMKGWKDQMAPDADLAEQERLWKWVRDNVDYRVRSTSA